MKSFLKLFDASIIFIFGFVFSAQPGGNEYIVFTTPQSNVNLSQFMVELPGKETSQEPFVFNYRPNPVITHVDDRDISVK